MDNEKLQYYGARWKTESGFKELKQEIGSQKSQSRNAQEVTNHLNFSMMATTLIWVYADRQKTNLERRDKVTVGAFLTLSEFVASLPKHL